MLGRTNTGGGGVGGVLTVTAPSGVTVSVSKDGKVKTKTANAECLAVFKGLKTGTWQLTITDGSQVSTKSVVITADYSTVIAFFMATISITYPEGSVCTCSDGVTTLTAPDTSGVWECIVSNAGTWTISCTDGNDSTDEVVEITSDGQSESIMLGYNYAITGGQAKYELFTKNWKSSTTTLTQNADSYQIVLSGTDPVACTVIYAEEYKGVSLSDHSKAVLDIVEITGSATVKIKVWSGSELPGTGAYSSYTEGNLVGEVPATIGHNELELTSFSEGIYTVGIYILKAGTVRIQNFGLK